MGITVQQDLAYQKYKINSKLAYFKPHQTSRQQSFGEEISQGLTEDSKFIHPKFFYDDTGSQLFEEICKLPEYYLTRTEIKLLKKLQRDLPNHLDGEFKLVELGSGSSIKTRLILDVLNQEQQKIEYFPIDISEIITESSQNLQKDYQNLHITGIIDSYEGGLEFLQDYDEKNNLIAFLGSSFGNFCPDYGHAFLKRIHSIMKNSDLFLIGFDLVKEKKILEKAYDDSQGVTAKFNLNVLTRINNELDADFDLDNFSHHITYNENHQRIEMYLRSTHKQKIFCKKNNLLIDFEKDELVHTENSHKYSVPQIKQLLNSAGFNLNNIWLDENQFYALALVSKN